jgi:xanthine dehydrogenase accessory factor
MNVLIDEVMHALDQKQDIALATIISKNGSAPRTTGAQMIIRSDGSIFGTIGGGKMEAMVIDLAKETIKRKDCHVTRIEMTGESAATGDMICGGIQDVLVEYLDPSDETYKESLRSYQDIVHQRHLGWWITRIPEQNASKAEHILVKDDSELVWGCNPIDGVKVEFASHEADEYHSHLEKGAPILTLAGKTFDLKGINRSIIEKIGEERWLIDPILFYGTVYIFGAGHVSQQLAKVTKLVGFRTVVIDDRAEFANVQRFPEVDEVVVVENYDALFEHIHLDPENYMVIVTRGHLHDRNVLRQCLDIETAYIGMIGSKRKVGLVYDELEKQGYDRVKIEKVHSPIGLKIGADTPEEIAISITGELIQVRNERTLMKMQDSTLKKCCEK